MCQVAGGISISRCREDMIIVVVAVVFVLVVCFRKPELQAAAVLLDEFINNFLQ